MSKSREWIAKGKFDISVIEQSLEYYKQDVKDSIHYTEEEKTIFLIMNVMGHFEALQKENERLKKRCDAKCREVEELRGALARLMPDLQGVSKTYARDILYKHQQGDDNPKGGSGE